MVRRVGDLDVVEDQGLAVGAGIERRGAVGLDVDVVFGAAGEAEDLVAVAALRSVLSQIVVLGPTPAV